MQSPCSVHGFSFPPFVPWFCCSKIQVWETEQKTADIAHTLARKSAPVGTARKKAVSALSPGGWQRPFPQFTHRQKHRQGRRTWVGQGEREGQPQNSSNKSGTCVVHTTYIGVVHCQARLRGSFVPGTKALCCVAEGKRETKKTPVGCNHCLDDVPYVPSNGPGQRQRALCRQLYHHQACRGVGGPQAHVRKGIAPPLPGVICAACTPLLESKNTQHAIVDLISMTMCSHSSDASTAQPQFLQH